MWLSACTSILATPPPTPHPPLPTPPSPSPSPDRHPDRHPTPTATVTYTATITLTSTITLTPTASPTATPDYPHVTVKMQANCRYGARTAYLYAGTVSWRHAEVRGKNWNVHLVLDLPRQPGKRNCWLGDRFEEQLDKSQLHLGQIPLPPHHLRRPPGNVQAVRNGNQVTVSWSPGN
jgi:hypothetical protein